MSTFCDPQTLITDGKCFSGNCLTLDQQRIARLQLLCEIVNNATGGVTSITAGAGITVDAATGDVTISADTLDQIPVATGPIDLGAQTISNFKCSVNTQTGTTYSVAASDCGKVIQFTNGSSVTFTVDTTLPDGGSVSVIQSGAGQVTVSPSGLTIRNNSGYTKTAAQYAAITLLRIGTDLYLTGAGA